MADDNGNLGLCFCYSDAGAVTEPGLTLLRAEPSIGVRQVDLGTLNTAPMPYLLPPTTRSRRAFGRTGRPRLLPYTPDSWAAGALLMRGTIRLDVA